MFSWGYLLYQKYIRNDLQNQAKDLLIKQDGKRQESLSTKDPVSWDYIYQETNVPTFSWKEKGQRNAMQR